MSKRDRGALGAGSDLGSRSKRIKETAVTGAGTVGQAAGIQPSSSSTVKKEPSGGAALVKEHGLRLWHTVKDAVYKDGRVISTQFRQQPSRSEYPDYYVIVKQPIALNDIKKKLDSGQYQTIKEAKDDFELCFSNAKLYNLKNSDIWKDAKHLLKLTIKEFAKLEGDSDMVVDVDGEADENADGDKKKGKSMNRLLKTRLQKLVDATDSEGRIIATEFMELPSKKNWPDYYKQIKRPQCLENIFKRLKRKEYHDSEEFANDVELVFSNALTFNQDHTPIWEDAVLLRDLFRKLMSDLPEPLAISRYSKPSGIKLKVPAAASPTSPTNQQPVISSLKLRVPAQHNAPSIPTAKAEASNTALPPVSAPPAPRPASPAKAPAYKAAFSDGNTLPVARNKAPTPQPVLPLPQPTYFNGTQVSHYPNALYTPSANMMAPMPAFLPQQALPVAAASQTSQSASNSPAPPPVSSHHQLRCVQLRVEPTSRMIKLDHRDGVKCWSLRMGVPERGLNISDVAFLGGVDGEEGASSGEEEEEDVPEKEEEEEGTDEPGAESPVKNGRRGRGRPKRGRGRPPKVPKVVEKAKQVNGTKKAKKLSKRESIQLKLNSAILKEKEACEGEWYAELPIGSSILEIGERGALIWKVYVVRG